MKGPFDLHEMNGSLLHPGGCKGGEGEFEPVWGNGIDGIVHPGYSHQKSGIRGPRGITGLDRLHHADIHAGGSQGSSQSRGHHGFSNSRIRPGDEETPAFRPLKAIEFSSHGKKSYQETFSPSIHVVSLSSPVPPPHLGESL